MSKRTFSPHRFFSTLVVLFSFMLIESRVFAVNVKPKGGEDQVNQTTSQLEWQPITTRLTTGNFVVVWAGDGGTPYFRIYNSAGAPLTDELSVDGSGSVNAGYPDVAALPGGGFVIAWQKVVLPLATYSFDVFARTFDGNGDPVSGVFRISQTTEEAQVRPHVEVLGDGRLFFVWEDDDFTYKQLRYRIYNANLTPATDDTSVATNQHDEPSGSDTAVLDDGTVLVAWSRPENSIDYQVRMRRIDPDNGPLGSADLANVNDDEGTSDQYSPAVCKLRDGSVVISWTSDLVFGSGDGYDSGEVIFQRFIADEISGDLEATGPAVQANESDQGSQVDPVLVPWGNGFLIGWTSENNRRNQGDDDLPTGRDGDGSGVFARSYAADGTAEGASFQINATTSDHQYQLSLVSLGDELVAAWTSDEQDGSFGGVYKRKLVELLPPQLTINRRNSAVLKYRLGNRRAQPANRSYRIGNSGDGNLRVRILKVPKWLRVNGKMFTVTPGKNRVVRLSLKKNRLPKRRKNLKKTIRFNAQNGEGSENLRVVAKIRA